MVQLGYSLSTQSSEEPLIQWVTVEKQGFSWKVSAPLALHEAKKMASPPELKWIQQYGEERGLVPPFGTLTSLLKELAALGRLFCEGKPVVVNFFAPFQLVYQWEGGTLLGCLRRKGEEIPLEACRAFLPGQPSFLLHGMTLRAVENCHRKWIQRLWPTGSSSLSREELRTLEKQLGGNAPSLEGGEEEAPVEPLPLLQLIDPKGAFAKLYLDYEGEKVELSDPRGVSPLGKKRQHAVERQWAEDLAESGYSPKHLEGADHYCPMDQVAKSLSFLCEMGWEVKDHQGRRVQVGGKWDLSFQKGSQAILVRGKVSYGEHEASLKEAVGAFQRREQFVQLSGEAVGLLPTGEEEEVAELLAQRGELVAGGVKMARFHCGLLAEVDGRGDAFQEELRQAIEGFTGLSSCAPGEGFQGELRGYQLEGLEWLHFLKTHRFHGLLADEMGLGKTVQVLAWISTFSSQGRVLVVVPTSLLFNWRQEAERFLPHHPIYVHHGTERRRAREEFVEGELVLTSYALLRRDRELLKEILWEGVILDEAQNIKNSQTQTAQAARSLQAEVRLSVTGTPVENRLEELWSHFHFLLPGLLGSKVDFEKEMIASQCDRRYLFRIQKMVAPFLLRRRKAEVAQDLPEKIEQTVWLEMGEEQRAAYESFLAQSRQGLLEKVSQDGVAQHRMEVLECLLRLRQLCCHPLLLSRFSQATESIKLKALMEELSVLEQEGAKVLVYSQFTSMLSLIHREIEEKGWKSFRLEGKTANRESVVKGFQEHEGSCVFLMSLKAGGVGLNLSEADVVVLYDPWWNEAAENQAIDRAHRIGRRQKVIAKRYVVAESVEEKIMKLKEHKRQLTDGLWSGESSLQSMTVEDLEFLLT